MQKFERKILIKIDLSTPESIAATRRALGLTQKQCSDLACLSQRTWESYEQRDARGNPRKNMSERVRTLFTERAKKIKNK